MPCGEEGGDLPAVLRHLQKVHGHQHRVPQDLLRPHVDLQRGIDGRGLHKIRVHLRRAHQWRGVESLMHQHGRALGRQLPHLGA